jgi:hypothetical protein
MAAIGEFPHADYDYLLKIIMVGDSGERLARLRAHTAPGRAALRVGTHSWRRLTRLVAAGVGKSALLKNFMGEEFTKHYVSTIGVDFEIKQLTMLDKKVHLQIVSAPASRSSSLALAASLARPRPPSRSGTLRARSGSGPSPPRTIAPQTPFCWCTM